MHYPLLVFALLTCNADLDVFEVTQKDIDKNAETSILKEMQRNFEKEQEVEGVIRISKSEKAPVVATTSELEQVDNCKSTDTPISVVQTDTVNELTESVDKNVKESEQRTKENEKRDSFEDPVEKSSIEDLPISLSGSKVLKAKHRARPKARPKKKASTKSSVKVKTKRKSGLP